MISKQIKGRSFSKLLNYLLGKAGARLIGSNMEDLTSRELAAEFRFSQQLNARVSRVVYHASLSLPHSEALENDTWQALAQKYLQAMGFDMNQYVVVRHCDRDHDHAHIVASRIRLDGTTVSDSWDYRRSAAVIRQLEQDYGLQGLHSSQDKASRSPTMGERRLLARTGEEHVRVRLQRSLDQATRSPVTMPQLIEQLQQSGISVGIRYSSTGEPSFTLLRLNLSLSIVGIRYSSTGEPRGISYALGEMAFSGTHLGKAYTFMGLQKYRGVDYDCDRDDELIQQRVDRSGDSSTGTISESVPPMDGKEIQPSDSVAALSNSYPKSPALKRQQQELEL